MPTLDLADALVILTKIKTFHGPQDDSDATCESWAQALSLAKVSSVPDAVQAVVRHYSTPGCNPWITPGDVIAGVQTIREARMKGVNDGDLTPDLPHDTPVREYLAVLRARAAAVQDGMPVRQAIVAVKASAAIEAAQ